MSERPLHEPTFLMLTALAKGPQHGYGIITDVEHISDGRVRLRAGTLYAALDRVVAEGLVEADRDEVVDGRVRCYYRLTQRGDDRLAAEVARLQHNAAVAAGRLEVRRRAFVGWAPRLLAGSRSPTGGCCAGTQRCTGTGTRRKSSEC